MRFWVLHSFNLLWQVAEAVHTFDNAAIMVRHCSA